MSHRCPTLTDLPPPPPERTGWPWTVESPQLPDVMPDGRPWPTISIVTPSYNQGAFVEETIRSVLLQGYPALEYIVLDGGSSDQSAAIIERYAPWLTHWASERDEGQSHAINKGFAMTRGEIFQWINSDDYLERHALRIVAEHCPQGGTFAAAVRTFGDGPERIDVNSDLSFEGLLFGNAVFRQPGVWLSRSLAARVFPLDQSFHYAFDWEMAMRAATKRCPIVYDSRVTTHFRLHPTSKTNAQWDHFTAEVIPILRKMSNDPALASVAEQCARALRKVEWRFAVDGLRASGQPGASLRIAAGMLCAPRERINRFALGALRRELSREGRELVARLKR